MVRPDNTPEKTPNILTEQFMKAQALQVAGKWQDSVDTYTKLEEEFGADARIFNGRGVAWRMLRNPAAAIADFTQARKLAQAEELTAVVGLIDAYRTANRDPNFNPWSDVQPENLQARLLQEAQVYMTEAEAILEKMPEPSLAKVNALTNFGLLHNDMGNLPQALDAYTQAEDIVRKLVAADPQNIDFQNRLARALTVKGITQEGSGLLEEAVASQEESLEIYKNLGDLRGLGNARLSLGDLFVKQGDIEAAKELYKQAKAGVEKDDEVIDPDIHHLTVERLAKLQTPPTSN